jgi:hypothetical protein
MLFVGMALGRENIEGQDKSRLEAAPTHSKQQEFCGSGFQPRSIPVKYLF